MIGMCLLRCDTALIAHDMHMLLIYPKKFHQLDFFNNKDFLLKIVMDVSTFKAVVCWLPAWAMPLESIIIDLIDSQWGWNHDNDMITN